MSLSARSSKLSLLSAGALVVLGFVSPGRAAAPPAPPGASACRATALQAQALGQTLPLNKLAEANGTETPCKTDNGSLLDINASDTGGLLEAHLLTARTQVSPATPANSAHAASARAGILRLAVHPGVLDPRLDALDVEVQGLQSEVRFACTGSQLGDPTMSSDGTVLKLLIGHTKVVELPNDLPIPNPLDVGPVHVYFNEVNKTSTSITRNALRIVVDDPSGSITAPKPLAQVVVAQAYLAFPAGGSSTACPPPPPPPPPPGSAVGWMTGGGQLNAGETHSLVLPCTTTQAHPGPTLKVQTPNGQFSLDTLSSVSCTMDTSIPGPKHPDAGFNTLKGSGTGTCNGVSGVPVSFTFTDEGEPNQGADKASISIGGHACPEQASGTVNGNQQAHRGTNPPA